MAMIKVTPAPGLKILDPTDSFRAIPAEGKVLPDSTYWRNRERDGGVVVSDPNAVVEVAAPEVAAPKSKKGE